MIHLVSSEDRSWVEGRLIWRSIWMKQRIVFIWQTTGESWLKLQKEITLAIW